MLRRAFLTIAAGLPPLRMAGGKETDAALPEPSAAPAEAAAPPPPAPAPEPQPQGIAKPTMIVDQPVRSGSRIWAQGSDLIVIGTVNPGAEVIADGNVHVYGRLLGRAIAGGPSALLLAAAAASKAEARTGGGAF
jgi:septum site-determining protein MinC